MFGMEYNLLFVLFLASNTQSSMIFQTFCNDMALTTSTKFSCDLYQLEKNLNSMSDKMEANYLKYFLASLNSTESNQIESFQKCNIHGFLTNVLRRLSLTNLKLIVPSIECKVR